MDKQIMDKQIPDKQITDKQIMDKQIPDKQIMDKQIMDKQIMDNSIFENDLKGQSGGIIISDIINGKKIIILGKSNIPKRKDSYESFGGHSEKEDISSLHTAIREMIEEFFNLKVETSIINDLAVKLRSLNLILKQYELSGMSYLINFIGLNFIFQKVCQVKKDELEKYNINNIKFNLDLYIKERIITDKSINGLNEIHSLKVFYLSDVINKKVNIRWITNKVVQNIFI